MSTSFLWFLYSITEGINHGAIFSPKPALAGITFPIGFTLHFGRKYPAQCPWQCNNPLRRESVYCYFSFNWWGNWVPEMQVTSPSSSQLLNSKKRAQACLWFQVLGSPLSWLALASIKTQQSKLMPRRRLRFTPCIGKIPWRRKWQPIPMFLTGKSHGQRSPEGHSPQGHKESEAS